MWSPNIKLPVGGHVDPEVVKEIIEQYRKLTIKPLAILPEHFKSIVAPTFELSAELLAGDIAKAKKQLVSGTILAEGDNSYTMAHWEQKFKVPKEHFHPSTEDIANFYGPATGQEAFDHDALKKLKALSQAAVDLEALTELMTSTGPLMMATQPPILELPGFGVSPLLQGFYEFVKHVPVSEASEWIPAELTYKTLSPHDQQIVSDTWKDLAADWSVGGVSSPQSKVVCELFDEPWNVPPMGTLATYATSILPNLARPSRLFSSRR